jgi:hypothetical protein
VASAGLCHTSAKLERPRLEVADIFRAHAEQYRESHALSPQQLKLLWDIENCRTAALGGHADVCIACGHYTVSFNSCRNRHCPKCQSLAQAQWIEQRIQRTIDTHYFHTVFTLPHELKPLATDNQKQIYDMLFRATSRTLLEFGHSRLGAQIGFTAVLHTWSRELLYHIHLHCIVTGGGLALSEDRWVPTRESYLFPIEAMSQLFRGKFLDALQKAYDNGEFDLSGYAAKLSYRENFRRLKDKLYRKDWIVYAKRPFGGPEQVFKYLGLYTHRVGISNRRLISMDDNGICFATKDGNTVTVAPQEFIRRFLLHVLPPSFAKIRHYGLMASSNSTSKLEVARHLIELEHGSKADYTQDNQPADNATAQNTDWRERLRKLTGLDLSLCPACKKGRTIRYSLNGIPYYNNAQRAPPFDSS